MRSRSSSGGRPRPPMRPARRSRARRFRRISPSALRAVLPRFHRADRADSADVQRAASRRAAALRSGARGRDGRAQAAADHDLRLADHRASKAASRAWASRAARGRTCGRSARISGARVGTSRAHGRAAARGGGAVRLSESRTLEEIAADPEAALIAPEAVIPIPTIVLDGRGSADFRAGRVVPLPSGATAQARLRPRCVAHARRRRRIGRRAARAAQGLRLVKIHHAFERRPADAPPLVLAIGFFDGFHRGHREIVRGRCSRERRPGFRAAVDHVSQPSGDSICGRGASRR